MGGLGAPELIIIGLVLVLLFGAKKLPDTARALGQSLRLFKKETTKLHEEDDARAAQTATATAPPVVVQPQPLPPSTPSVEDRLRLLEDENTKLRATSQTSGSPVSQGPKDQGSV